MKQDDTSTTFKPSKRFKNPKSHARYKNRMNKEKGLEYQTTTGKTVPKKVFRKIECKCRMQCHVTIDGNVQKDIFNTFYGLSSWSEKTLFLTSHIKSTECSKRRTTTKKMNATQFKKKSSRSYYLTENENQKVCKSFFKKVLQVSEGRIDYCFKKFEKTPNQSSIDLRGKHPSHRKTSPAAIRDVIQFIKSFPQYQSHYTRGISAAARKYLEPSLNLRILYNEYKKQHANPVSMYMFRDTFFRRFNLKFKPPLLDTCDKCNKLQMQIKSTVTKPELKIKLHEQKTDHLQLVEFISREYKENIDNSKLSGGKKIVLVFDLEKVFDTPKLDTNSAYYKRKLSTFNFCVHDATNNRSYMYIWHEGIASRGPQEITSCLIYHINTYVSKDCSEIFLYSDSCGGQNRNIKTALMLSHLLDGSENLTKITQSFFLTGHSYNVCDRKFGIIERKKRNTTNIYTTTQWKNLIENAKVTLPKFIVNELSSEKIFGCDVLQAISTNRKKTITKEPVNWFKTHIITYKKGQPFLLFVESYDDLKDKFNEAHEIQRDYSKTISIQKRGVNVDNFGAIKLPVLYPNGRTISMDKKKDLLDLLQFVPLEYHSFYTNLNHGSVIRTDEARILMEYDDSDSD